MYGVLGARSSAAMGVGTVSGTLPFTGLSLVWWVLLAATLILTGASLLRTGHVLGRTRRGDRPEAIPSRKT